MTNSKKQIFNILFKGGFIVNNGEFGIRVLDQKSNPIMKATARRFYLIKHLLKKNKRGLWVISPKEVLKLRKNTWVKIEYKKLRNEKS
jgi:hypothetical protein